MSYELIKPFPFAPDELREPVPRIPDDFARIVSEETHIAQCLLPEVTPLAFFVLVAAVEVSEVACQ